MLAATEVAFSPLDLDPSEWASVCAHRPNVLIEGPVEATLAVLRRLQPHMGEPAIWQAANTPFELPSGEAQTLILEDVAALTRANQVQLLARLDRREPRTQVVSTSEHALFGLVTRGLFDAALYYRLNVVVVRV